MFPSLAVNTFMQQKIISNTYQKTNEIENQDIEQVQCSDSKELDFAWIQTNNAFKNIDLVFLIRFMIEYKAKNTCYANVMDKFWFTMIKNELLSLIKNLM